MTDQHHLETLADRLVHLETSSTSPRSRSPSSPKSPVRSGPSSAPGGINNVPDTGSVMEGDSSLGAEGRVSVGGSRTSSRRGSGVVLTPNGGHTVYHTRTNVSSSTTVERQTGNTLLSLARTDETLGRKMSTYRMLRRVSQSTRC